MHIDKVRAILSHLADTKQVHPVRSPGVVKMAGDALKELEGYQAEQRKMGGRS